MLCITALVSCDGVLKNLNLPWAKKVKQADIYDYRFVDEGGKGVSAAQIERSKVLFDTAVSENKTTGDNAAAAAQIKEAIRLYPSPEYYIQLGEFLFKTNSPVEAGQSFDAALELKCENPGFVYFQKARAASIAGAEERAIIALNNAASNGYKKLNDLSEDPDFYNLRDNYKFFVFMAEKGIPFTIGKDVVLGTWEDVPFAERGKGAAYSFYHDKVVYRPRQGDIAERYVTKTGTYEISGSKVNIRLKTGQLLDEISIAAPADDAPADAEGDAPIDADTAAPAVESSTKDVDLGGADEITLNFINIKIDSEHGRLVIESEGSKFWRNDEYFK